MLVTALRLRRGLTPSSAECSPEALIAGEPDDGRPATETPAELGDYEVAEVLGTGGFGSVHRATRRRIGGEVAIKLIHAARATDSRAVERFVAEARVVNRIRHPGIVDVFDFGTAPDGRPFLVMELLRGRTLHALLADRGRLAF